MFLFNLRRSPDEGGGQGGQPSGPSGGQAGGEQSGGQQAGQSFDYDKWDGKPESLPDDNARKLHAAISKRAQSEQSAKNGNALADHLRRTFAESQRQPQRPPQPQPGQGGQGGQGGPKYLTEEDLARHNAEQERARRIQAWQNNLTELVSKPQKFGDASYAFSSTEEVDQFNNWMRQKFSEGLTPADMLRIYKFDHILEGHASARVKSFEEKLKGGGLGGGVADGKAPPKQAPPKKAPEGSGGPVRSRVPDSEAFIKQANPALYEKIMSGEYNPITGN